MSEEGKSIDSIIYLEARPQDVESLTSIVPRAFFPVNEFMKNLIPDTPATRAWWGRVFEEYINSPAHHLLIAVDTLDNVVIGLLSLRGVKKGEPFGGFMRYHPATEDHDPVVWPQAITGFAEDEQRVIGDRDRFLIEIMGVDHAYKGKGIGKQLVANCCKVADAKEYPIFLESSQAAGFYANLGRGFHLAPLREEDAGESQCILVREPMGKEDYNG